MLPGSFFCIFVLRNCIFMSSQRISFSLRDTLAVCLIALILISLGSCGVGKQRSALKTFEKCHIEVVGIQQLSLAGVALDGMLQRGEIDPMRLPGVALGFLTGKLPFTSTLQIQITNPTRQLAGVGEFEYKLAIEGRELLAGHWTDPIQVPPGASLIVDVPIQTDIYPLLKDRELLDKILAYFQQKGNQEPVNLSLQLKPTLEIGSKKVQYPKFFTIERKIDPSKFIR